MDYTIMLEELFHMPENEAEPFPLGEWFYELICCPSQCYYRLKHKGVDYIMYLRWRWEDPWQAHVVRNAASLDEMHSDDAVWLEDVFALHHLHYRDDELELAKERIVSLFHECDGDFPATNRPRP
jgi:hypothetical protein